MQFADIDTQLAFALGLTMRLNSSVESALMSGFIMTLKWRKIMKIIVTGNFDEMATVLDKLRNIKTKEYAEEIQQGDEDIIKAMRAKLDGLRNILALNVEKKEQTTLTANEAADLVDFIDTFLV